MTYSFDHLQVAVTDLEPAIGAYARMLGRRPAWRGEQPALGIVNAIFKLENMKLELIAPDAGAGAWLRESLVKHGEGLWGLVFSCVDLASTLQAWTQTGLPLLKSQPGLGRDTDSGAFLEWTEVVLPTAATRGLPLALRQYRTPEEVLPPSTALFEESGAIDRLERIVLHSGDLSATRALYQQQLGLPLVQEPQGLTLPERACSFRVGEVQLQCVEEMEAQEAKDALRGVVWQVADAVGARSRMVEAGIAITDTPVFEVLDGTRGVHTLVVERSAR